MAPSLTPSLENLNLKIYAYETSVFLHHSSNSKLRFRNVPGKFLCAVREKNTTVFQVLADKLFMDADVGVIELPFHYNNNCGKRCNHIIIFTPLNTCLNIFDFTPVKVNLFSERSFIVFIFLKELSSL